jgi:colanic acid biosynthesis protein WcaH
MLDLQTFKAVIENTSLVSIDLCLICNDQILLAKRNNEPLKGRWFTPDGRIYKNESWQTSLQRIALTELGLSSGDCASFELMGVWDHFYPNSACDDSISTHYVNLPHFARSKSKPAISGDDQHHNLDWFDLDKVISNDDFHMYVQNHASYLINKGLRDIRN